MPFDHEGVKAEDVQIDLEEQSTEREDSTPDPKKTEKQDNEDKTTKRSSCCSLRCFLIVLLLLVFASGLAGAASYIFMKDQVLTMKDQFLELIDGSEP